MPAAYVTQSCHTPKEVGHARESGVDAVLFGPVFGKWVAGKQVVPGLGLERLAEAATLAAGMDLFALGGVDEDRAEACLAAGATGVAAIRMFFGAPFA